MDTISSQTILKEFRSIQTDANSGINASFLDNNIYKWRVTLFGPPQSPYAGGVFPALIEFPRDYPNNPPKIKFLCPIYHPNVLDNGDVCIPMIDTNNFHEQTAWSPQLYSIQSVIIAVQTMLSEPDFEYPSNLDVAKTYYSNPREFMRKVKRSLYYLTC